MWQFTRMPRSARKSPNGLERRILSLGALVLTVLCARPCYCDDIAVNPVTNKIYFPVAGGLGVLDGATHTRTTIAGVLGGSSIALNPVTNKVYISNGPYSGIISPLQLTVVDGATNTVVAIVAGAAGPIAVNPVTDKIYVSSLTGVSVIDGTTNATTDIPLASPGPIAVNAATNKIYATNGLFSGSPSTSSVVVIDGATNATTALSGFAGALAVNAVTNTVYVANLGHDEVIVIDGATNTTTTVPLGSNPYAIALNPVTNKVYVAGIDGNNVTVIDGAMNTTTTIPVGPSPHGIEVNPVTNKVYVLDGGGVTVIDGATNATSALNAGTNTEGIAINPVTGNVYVTNDGSDDLTVVGAGGAPPSPTPPSPTSASLTNISVRAQVGTGGNILIPGFVVEGSGTENVLIRCAGPALATYGVVGPLAIPSLGLFDAAGTMVASNTGWGSDANPAGLAGAAARAGAFAFAPGSADCALIASLPAGGYTVQVSGVGDTTGIALAEVYELSSSGTHLANISCRSQVGAGANAVIAGFVISGSGRLPLLMRADGIALAQFGVAGVLAKPTLSLFGASGETIASNTGWAGAGIDLISAFEATVGTFPLVAGSADSAQVVDLPPGNYTMQVSGAAGSTGVALAEIFEVP